MKRLLVFFLLLLNPLFLQGQVGRSAASLPLRQSIKELLDADRLQEARERLKQEVAARGESGETLYLEGMILFKQKNFAESLKVVEHSLALGLRDAEVYKLIAFNAVVLNKTEVIEGALNAALPLAPGDFTIHFHLGLLYFTTNRFAKAENEFQTVTQLNRSYMKGYDLLGQAQEELEKDEAAFTSYCKAVELTEKQNLKDESAYLHLAKFYWARNRHQESLGPVQKAVEINPRSAEAYYVLGRLLDELGQEAEAIKALRQSTEIDAGSGESYYLLSRIYLRRGQQDDATKAMNAFRGRRTSSMPSSNKSNLHSVEEQ